MNAPMTDIVAKSVTTRLAKRFADLKAEGRGGLVTYVMSGDPDLDTAQAIINGLPGAGADIIVTGTLVEGALDIKRTLSQYLFDLSERLKLEVRRRLVEADLGEGIETPYWPKE